MQQILIFPFTALTNWLVFDAIPDKWVKKFKATRSPINIFLELPITIAIISPFLILDPSFLLETNLIFLSISLKVFLANSSPAIIPLSLDINLALIVELLLIKSEVISPDG